MWASSDLRDILEHEGLPSAQHQVWASLRPQPSPLSSLHWLTLYKQNMTTPLVPSHSEGQATPSPPTVQGL